MNITNVTDYDNDIDIIIEALSHNLSLSGLLFLCLISLIIYSLLKPLL